MNTKTIIYFVLGSVSLIIALVIFFYKFFNFWAFLFFVLGITAVLFFRQGLAENKKNEAVKK